MVQISNRYISCIPESVKFQLFYKLNAKACLKFVRKGNLEGPFTQIDWSSASVLSSVSHGDGDPGRSLENESRNVENAITFATVGILETIKTWLTLRVQAGTWNCPWVFRMCPKSWGHTPTVSSSIIHFHNGPT